MLGCINESFAFLDTCGVGLGGKKCFFCCCPAGSFRPDVANQTYSVMGSPGSAVSE